MFVAPHAEVKSLQKSTQQSSYYIVPVRYLKKIELLDGFKSFENLAGQSRQTFVNKTFISEGLAGLIKQLELLTIDK